MSVVPGRSIVGVPAEAYLNEALDTVALGQGIPRAGGFHPFRDHRHPGQHLRERPAAADRFADSTGPLTRLAGFRRRL